MQKKYQVFVSSTFRDLVDERQDAIRSILDLGHIPAGMELFPAADTEQLSYIKRVIDECDYYILIMGGRYGSLDREGVSFTEREYDYAIETKKTVLAFIHGEPDTLPVKYAETAPELQRSLEEFKAKVSKGRLVRFWNTRAGLEPLVLKSLARAFSEMPQAGWIRGNAAASEDILQQLNDLRVENTKLATKNRELQMSLKPAVDGLASLDTAFLVRYYYDIGNQRRQHSFSATWLEIFLSVGPDFMKPTSPAALPKSLRKLAQEQKNIGVFPTFFETDVEKIKLQLMALGLLDCYTATAVSGGVSEFAQLTDLGRKALIELSAIRN